MYSTLSNLNNPSPKRGEKQKEIPSSIEYLQKTVSDLHSHLNELQCRLKCISSCEPACDSKVEPVPVPSTIQDSLNCIRNEIGVAVSKIQTILRLLEV